ncbi:MAG: YmdB family metallophosphoesterase [Dysosmobacter sp.]
MVNGENAAAVGLTPEQAERIYDAGADVVTLGNHAFGKLQIADFLDDAPGCCAPPTLPAGRRAGAAASMTWAACASG